MKIGKENENTFRIIDFPKFVELDNQRAMGNYKIYPCVTPSWDNSARRKTGGITFVNTTPQAFYSWIKGKLRKFSPYSEEENFLFINAWNEWAEGNHLEPDQKFGKAYLEAVKKAMNELENK